MKNIFLKTDVEEAIARINKLQPGTKPQWGKMNVAEMLAHVNVSYEMAIDNKHPRPGAVGRFFAKLFAKNMVVGDKPYPRNSPTAPIFKVGSNKDFEAEKKRLIEYMHKTQALGAAHFENKESLSFGPLSSKQWNTLFYKHLDHHLQQFGV